MNKHLNYLTVDWLAFTYKPTVSDLESDDSNLLVHFIRKFPELQDIILDSVTVRSRFGYNKTLQFNDDFLILYNDFSEDLKNDKRNPYSMGVNFQVPSHSLELFCDCFGIEFESNNALFQIMELLHDRGCQLSRIDLCFDDYGKKFNAKYYIDKWVRGLFRSHFQTATMFLNQNQDGNTFYLGSLKKRSKLLRIYDKFVESGGIYDCVRYEFEYHAENARDVMAYILGGGTIEFFPYLRSWFEVIKESNNTTNKSDIPLDNEWEEYFSESVFCEKIIIPRYDNEYRSKEVTSFIENQVLPSLKGYIQLFGWDYLRSELEKSDINKKYLGLINSIEYKNSVGWCAADDSVPFN